MKMRVALMVLAVTLAAGGCAWLPLPETGPAVVISPGLTPRMTPPQVEDRVLSRIHSEEQAAGQVVKPARILRVTATTGARIAEIEPSAKEQLPVWPGIVWVVRAEGTLLTDNGRFEPSPQPPVTSGYYVIADADGSVLGIGFP